MGDPSPVPHPACNRKERKIAYVVMMQMGEEDRFYLCGVSISAHHVVGRASAAIEHVMAAVIQCQIRMPD